MSFPSEKQLRDRFAQAENAVYFATADKRSRYYGFGIAEDHSKKSQTGQSNNAIQSLVDLHSMTKRYRIAN